MNTENKIIRVFPVLTHATPNDELVRVNTVPSLFDMELAVDAVHISVAFTWHKRWAEWAAKQWERVAPVRVGGPAYNEPGGDFVPGRYMKRGYVITSRGCPNRCWFCSVPLREGGKLRELPVTEGWIVTDDNLLACSPGHIDEVFTMLKQQPHRPQFTGGLEAALLTPEYAARLKALRPKTLYFAYDTPNDWSRSLRQVRCCIRPDSRKRAIAPAVTCYVAIRATRSTKRSGAWARHGVPASCLLLWSIGIPEAVSRPNGSDFKNNGLTELLRPSTA